MRFEDVRTVFLDYDGCLHDSMKIYGPAFRKTYQHLVELGAAKEREWEDAEISRWLGYNSREMWRLFLPERPDLQEECMEMVAEEQRQGIEQGRAALYPGAEETLQYLRGKGCRLIFISNCRRYYRDAHNRAFGLNRYFDELVCSEQYGFRPKHEILASVMRRYPGKMAMVGDRWQDMEAGHKNGIYTIGCAYGFSEPGELDQADAVIGSVTDLKALL